MDLSLFLLPCWREAVAPTLERFYEELAETVALAEALGWERVWLSEHHFHYYGGACPNPAMLLLDFARRTRRIRLGPAISLLPLNHPLRVAEDYAMLDRLSGGRLEMGIGRGYLPHELAGFNIAEAETAARFREAFEIIETAWRGGRFSYDGEHYRLPELRLHPTPAQDPVPIWVACSRTRESFAWTGRRGFDLLMNHYPMSRAEMEERFGWYKAAYAEAGHDPAQRRAAMTLFLHLADSEEQAIAEAKAAVQEHANLFRLLRAGEVWTEDYGGDESVFSYLAPDGDVTALFRERTLIGTPAQVAERVAAFRALGFTEISFIVRYGTLSHAQCLANLRQVHERLRG